MQHPETMQVIYREAQKNGPVDINVSDFDESLHMRLDEVAKPKKRGRPAKTDKTESNDANG